MKITRFGLFTLAFLLTALCAFAQTNAVPAPEAVQGAGSAIAGLLAAKYGWFKAALAWATMIRVSIIPIFSVQIRHFMFDKMNEIAASSDQDDDAYLMELFSAKWYSLTAFVLRFIGITLPVKADLIRALDLQKQAVIAANAGK